MRYIPIASIVLPSFAALGIFQDLEHCGGRKNPGRLVLLQGEGLLVARHEEIGFTGFGQREQVTVLEVRRYRAGGKVPAIEREVAKTRRQQFRRAGAESRPE